MTRPHDTFLVRHCYPDGRQMVEVGRRQRAFIDLRRHRCTLELRVSFSAPPTHSSPFTEICLRVCPEPSALWQVDGIRSPAWHMAAGLLHRNSGDIFARILRAVYEKAVRTAGLPYEPQLDLPFSYQRCRQPGGSVSSQFASSVGSSMRVVASVFAAAAIHAAELCEPRLLRIARRFSPCMRPWVYEKLAGDGSGRLAQLAISCPGALVFAFALTEQAPTRPIAERILVEAIAGRRLNALLRCAVADWSAMAEKLLSDNDGLLERPWRRIRDSGTSDKRRIEEGQYLLIRRAAPRVAPTYLFTPPPLSFAPEDVPVGTRRNARWFRTMKSSIALVAPSEEQSEVLLRELSGFASRHFDALHTVAGGRMQKRIKRLAEYVLATERHTSRKTCPSKLMSECNRWHREAYRNLPLGGPNGPDARLESRFSPRIVDEWSNGRVSAARVRTVGELLNLGREMKHCAGSLARSALSGVRSIYDVRVDGRRLAVSILHLQSGRPYVDEARGVANREPSPAEIQALKPWLCALGVPG